MKLAMAAGLLVLVSMSGAKASTIDFSSNNGSALSRGDFIDGEDPDLETPMPFGGGASRDLGRLCFLAELAPSA